MKIYLYGLYNAFVSQLSSEAGCLTLKAEVDEHTFTDLEVLPDEEVRE